MSSSTLNSSILNNNLKSLSISHPFSTISEYSLLTSVLLDTRPRGDAIQAAVTSLNFDNLEELLWVSSDSGYVTSYYSYQLQKYTSFQVHSVNAVCALLTGTFGVLSLTPNSLRLSLRRGLPAFDHTSNLLQKMTCMTALPSGLILMGGCQNQMIEFDLERIKQVRITEIGENGCIIVRQHPKFVCCGDRVGKITLRDPNTLRVQHSFTTHSISLSDFDVHGNYLVSCGYSNRHLYVPDRFLMVYDLRMMRSVAPFKMMFSPFFLRFLPAFSSRFCVVSDSGQFQLLDFSSSINAPFIHNVDIPVGTVVTSFNVSNSGQSLAFSDHLGNVYLYGASNEVNFNNFSNETEFPDIINSVPSLSFTDLITPYSTLPMPYCNDEKLLSDWPPNLCVKTYRLPKPIDPDILNTMKKNGKVYYAPNPGIKARNQMPYKSPENSKTKQSISTQPASIKDSIPVRYLLIEPNHNKVVLDEYDFSRFNHSPFSGLDSSLPNSYSNNIIQSLYYITPFRIGILNHICHREFCLSCELSFLFHMIKISSTRNPCQASNFLRAFRTIPEASGLSLILPEDEDLRKKVNFSRLSQSWIRFMLHQLHSELSLPLEIIDESSTTKPSASSMITDMFGMEQVSSFECKCGFTWEQKTVKYPITLIYSDEVLNLPSKSSFNNLLKKSLNADQNVSAYCEKCNKFQYVTQSHLINSLPKVLAINCGLDNDKGMKFWKSQTGDKNSIKLQDLPNLKKPCRYGSKCTRSDCKFSHETEKNPDFEDNQDLKPFISMKMFIKITESNKLDVIDKSENNQNYIEYNLINIVSIIKKSDEPNKDNIVSVVKVVDENKNKKRINDSSNNWYLFNHFCINQITLEEITHLDLNWKIPSIITYCRADFLEKFNDNLKIEKVINPEVFSDDRNLASQNHGANITFIPLSTFEMLSKGDIVAMDAEFVTLNQEETEIRSDGTRATIKPPHRSVGRITCIRGSGPLEGHPFIDDYIATQDQVADYMTKFSGIQPGDLDVTISSKHLTTLKSTYLKLRFLVDNGIVFIGHGLKNDFQVINLVVPQNQIIDTLTLFQSPRSKRRVSLRFLAWHFLGIKIQSEFHDSIEDAKTALILYRKFEELKEHKRVEEAIEELYDAGRNSGWEVLDFED